MSDSPEYSIVKILHKDTVKVAGAGFLIGKKWVLTCRHVVENTLSYKDSTLEHSERVIDLMFYLDKGKKTLKSHVFFCPQSTEDDFAILELEDEIPSCACIGKIINITDYWRDNLRVCGFSDIGEARWVPLIGMGPVGATSVQIDISSATGYKIKEGFSGTPVLDTKLKRIIGIVTAKETAEDTLSGVYISIKAIYDVCRQHSINLDVFEFLDEKMGIEIKRGYEVLPDNRIRFGLLINNSGTAISEVEVIIEFSDSLFELEGSEVVKLGTIPPFASRTVKFILKPRSCIHKEEVGALIRYRDHEWEKKSLEMLPKEIYCVCPFLKEKVIKKSDFLNLLESSYSVKDCISFKNIPIEEFIKFFSCTYKDRMYKVDEFSNENGKVLYLAGDSLGEKAYYLVTANIIEKEKVILVSLQANSDNSFGIHGFLSEFSENLNHLLRSASSAKEIGIIKNEQLCMQQENKLLKNEREEQGKLRRQQEEETPLKKAEEEKIRKQKEEIKRKTHQEEPYRQRQEAANAQTARQTAQSPSHQEVFSKKSPSSYSIKKPPGFFRKRFFVFSLVFGILLIGAAVSFLDSSSNSAQTSPLQKDYKNSVGMEFVEIPAGEFMMGLPSDQEGIWDLQVGWDTEGPVHNVTIEESYYLGKYEVTQKQWREVMGNNPSKYKDDDLPVEHVSWNDAQDFIKKLNEMEGTDKYRLPSEAEWEYACRAGTTTAYYFGNDKSKLGDYAWYFGNLCIRAHPVGKKKPNSWGLYDMYGNVREWVQDRSHWDYNGAPSNGSIWESGPSRFIGSGSERVVRGGGWNHESYNCMSASRNIFCEPDLRDGDLGFRVLREI